ncbi:hypothetical protein H4R33_001765 [Dimargaris cristalligena]|uniref:Uncharacterized protein n=1 Tax=Dimargaris cristalligena TaxID=215637 RepID=A0A4P9ZYY5_9FUNG|nr:hypothetical protein H4R33_001765 [Dimargaris cristalligena]RKP38966.1 hypothetical protein BJ085DRAFT_31193 [Dimargaris cristalligena]|eukprot:RKP38966.1 hypothetical protein BJ085DRAFT_31193 [Dimargaris cristalligena]
MSATSPTFILVLLLTGTLKAAKTLGYTELYLTCSPDHRTIIDMVGEQGQVQIIPETEMAKPEPDRLLRDPILACLRWLAYLLEEELIEGSRNQAKAKPTVLDRLKKSAPDWDALRRFYVKDQAVLHFVQTEAWLKTSLAEKLKSTPSPLNMNPMLDHINRFALHMAHRATQAQGP